MKRINTIKLAAILFGLALLLNAFCLYRAAHGDMAFRWMERNTAQGHLFFLVPYAALILIIAVKRSIRKLRALTVGVRFILSTHKKV